MRRCFLLALLIVSSSAQALQSIRVGSQLLVVGDSAAHVMELLGKPSLRAKGHAGKARQRKGAVRFSRREDDWKTGERWQYRRDGHTTTFFIVEGKIAHIEDVAR
ncbi:hypothetical protein [Dyella flagellata]|uniref:DUF2845 domain-containing protein n=1 Tax=Dyella flagellata TaxID=1867833 RepID=A0ABQ5XIQ2_9GAMM|nr:hypothetical protein [Dyella flagellata]GLQ90923.1 hypothetical protein GCM10007898_44990 [Dyella flagellata]